MKLNLEIPEELKALHEENKYHSLDYINKI